MIGLAPFRNHSGVDQVGIVGAVANGERLDPLRIVSSHQRDDATRVNATAQRRPKRDIADHVRLNGAVQCISQLPGQRLFVP